MRTGKQRWKRLAAMLTAACLTGAAAFPAAAAESAMDVICALSGIVSLEDGSFLVTDTYNKVVWKVSGRTSTLYAGNGGVQDLYGEPSGGYNDGALNEGFFREPWAIAPFLDGYAVTDTENNVVRLIRCGDNKIQTATGTIQGGSADGYGLDAAFSRPTGLAADGEGNLYIADTGNNAIRRLTPTGTITTYAAGLSEPTGLCWKDGVLYVAESGANRILTITDGAVSVLAGSGAAGMADGDAMQAQMSNPQGVAAAPDGTVYVADTGNSAVRRIAGGTVTTLAAADQPGMEAFPVEPRGLMVRDGDLYVCDHFLKKIWIIPR